MNNQEPQSRMQRYNFNTDDQSASKRKPPKKPSHFRQIVVSFLITLVLVVGVGAWLANRSTKVENGAQNTEQSVKDNSSSHTESDNASKETGNSDSNNSTDDKEITSSQRSSLQSSINQESDATIKNSEQKKLDDTKTKSGNQQSSSSANTTSNSAGSSKKTDNSKKNSGSITFSQSHTFSSVADAKSWAQATKSQWLKDGYSTYTITSDAQGNYVLRFVK